jgi:hypothetical protein
MIDDGRRVSIHQQSNQWIKKIKSCFDKDTVNVDNIVFLEKVQANEEKFSQDSKQAKLILPIDSR